MKKALIAMIFLTSITGCRNNEVTPQQLYGDWYFVGTFSHLADWAIDYSKIDLPKLPLVQILNDVMVAKTNQFEYKSNIKLSNEYTHPQELALSGKISQKNVSLNYFGQSQMDSSFANGLKKSSSYYFQTANSKYYQLSLNFENTDGNFLVFLKAR